MIANFTLENSTSPYFVKNLEINHNDIAFSNNSVMSGIPTLYNCEITTNINNLPEIDKWFAINEFRTHKKDIRIETERYIYYLYGTFPKSMEINSQNINFDLNIDYMEFESIPLRILRKRKIKKLNDSNNKTHNL